MLSGVENCPFNISPPVSPSLRGKYVHNSLHQSVAKSSVIIYVLQMH